MLGFNLQMTPTRCSTDDETAKSPPFNSKQLLLIMLHDDAHPVTLCNNTTRVDSAADSTQQQAALRNLLLRLGMWQIKQKLVHAGTSKHVLLGDTSWWPGYFRPKRLWIPVWLIVNDGRTHTNKQANTHTHTHTEHKRRFKQGSDSLRFLISKANSQAVRTALESIKVTQCRHFCVPQWTKCNEA